MGRTNPWPHFARHRWNGPDETFGAEILGNFVSSFVIKLVNDDKLIDWRNLVATVCSLQTFCSMRIGRTNGSRITRRAGAGKSPRRKTNYKARGAAAVHARSAVG